MSNQSISYFRLLVLISFSTLTKATVTESANEPIANQPIITILPHIDVYPNGTIVRSSRPWTLAPPQPHPDPLTGVVSRDITLDPTNNITARMYIPFYALDNHQYDLPILVYCHGGAFCVGSPFTLSYSVVLNKVVSQGHAICISVNYRLFSEFALLTAYNDAWFAVQWVITQQIKGSDPWLTSQGNISRLFLGGDSARANIVHNLTIRTIEKPLPLGVRIRGAFLAMPAFLGSVRVPLEPLNFSKSTGHNLWPYVCPRKRCPNSIDDPVINPLASGALSFKNLATANILVYTAEKDMEFRGRDIQYVENIQQSGWKGNLLSYEAKNVDHDFQLIKDMAENSETPKYISRFAPFLQN